MTGKILVVDASERYRRVVGDFIEANHPNIITLEARTYDEAHSAIEQEPDISLMVSEFLIPFSHSAFVKMLGHLRDGSSYVPVVLYTNLPRSTTEKLAEEVFIDATILKASGLRIFYSCIDELLSNPHAYKNQPRVEYRRTPREMESHQGF